MTRPGHQGRDRSRQHGVTLIEAMVALLIMAFGMLALVGLQSNMRRSADLAKQRGEAIRLVQQKMEQLRDYSVLTAADAASAPAGAKAFDDLSTPAVNANAGEAGSNATFVMSQTVTDWVETSTAALAMKAVSLNVSWQDRTDQTQFVEVHSFLTRADPGLGGELTVPPVSSPVRRPAERDAAIPTGAKDLGNKTSVFKPQTDGTVAWVFNNLTGVIVGKCSVPWNVATAALTTADVESCNNNTVGYLLRGYVRFSDAATPNADQPSSPALPLLDMVMDVTGSNYPVTPRYECFDDAPTVASSLITVVSYNCVVYPNSDTTRNWSGSLTISGIPLGGSDWQVCRYSADYDGNGSIGNAEHPLAYSNVTRSLTGQNFLVVRASATCPAGHTIDPARGFFSNTATVLHQPDGI